MAHPGRLEIPLDLRQVRCKALRNIWRRRQFVKKHELRRRWLHEWFFALHGIPDSLLRGI
jgi:hypothetical protein